MIPNELGRGFNNAILSPLNPLLKRGETGFLTLLALTKMLSSWFLVLRSAVAVDTHLIGKHYTDKTPPPSALLLGSSVSGAESGRLGGVVL